MSTPMPPTITEGGFPDMLASKSSRLSGKVLPRPQCVLRHCKVIPDIRLKINGNKWGGTLWATMDGPVNNARLNYCYHPIPLMNNVVHSRVEGAFLRKGRFSAKIRELVEMLCIEYHQGYALFWNHQPVLWLKSPRLLSVISVSLSSLAFP